MSSFPILDLVIGMIFIYFLLSIICSSAVELWFSMLNTRANLLTKWLIQIFDKPALDSNGNPKLVLNTKGEKVLNSKGESKAISVGQEIMNHCMVTALSTTGKSTAYIDAENFVSALLDKITIPIAVAGTDNVQLPPIDLPGYITAIQQSPSISGELKRTILALANDAALAAKAINTVPAAANVVNNITTEIKSEMELFRDKLKKWYDTTADRITGTLKRTKAMPATLIIGLLFTIGLNVDSINISKYLYSHPEVSKQLADKAINESGKYKNEVDSLKKLKSIIIKNASDSSNIEQLDNNLKKIQENINKFSTALPQDLPLGWSNVNASNPKEILAIIECHFLGWIATILAISLGAPFWFDILNKIANLRGTGPKPASSSNADTKSS